MRRLSTIALSAIVLGAAGTASAQVPMTGGAYGQTLRFAVAGADALSTTTPGCSATVRLLTRDLLPAAEAQFDLRPGESRFVNVDLSPLAGSPGRRVELLPYLPEVRGDCSASIEVYETSSGRTMAHLAGLLLPAAPGLLLPAAGARLAPIGVGNGQVLRLGVIRGFDPQPDPPKCAATLGFADADGSPVGPSRAVDLEVGASVVIDVDATQLPPAAGESPRARRFVRPRLLLPAAGGGDLAGCRASVQLFDRRTGNTTAVTFGQ